MVPGISSQTPEQSTITSNDNLTSKAMARKTLVNSDYRQEKSIAVRSLMERKQIH